MAKNCIPILLTTVLFLFGACKKEKKRLEDFQNDNDAVMMKMHQNMEGVPMTEDNGLDFARMMAAHHQGAVDMVDVIMKYSKHDDMKTLASKIREGNLSSINRLNSFVSSHGPAVKDSTHMMFMSENNLAMAKMKETMMAAHYTSDPDYDFAQMMIHHHQGAVDMARIAIKYAHDAGAKAEAQKTLEQENEIRELAQWLNSHGEPQKHKKKSRRNTDNTFGPISTNRRVKKGHFAPFF